MPGRGLGLVPVPIRMIRATLVELLEGAPDPEVELPVRQAVHHVRTQFGLDEPYLRMTKVGPKLYVEVDFLVTCDEWGVEDEDRMNDLAWLSLALWTGTILAGRLLAYTHTILLVGESRL